MDNDGILYHFSADATIHPTQGRVTCVVLTGGSDAATLVLKDGGASGTTKVTIKAAINTTVVVPLRGANFSTDIYADITGTAPAAMVEVV